MPQMKGAGVTLAYIFPGIPYWAGVVLVGAVITLNVALGGMKGDHAGAGDPVLDQDVRDQPAGLCAMAVFGFYNGHLGANLAPGEDRRTGHER